MKINKFDNFLNESYPGRLNRFYDEQINKPSYDNIFSTLFQHLNIWYNGYKVNVNNYKITR